RFGALKVIAVGIALMGACVAVALSGIALWQFWTALLLLGVGWNFMYTGGTTLLIDAYTPAEKAKTQGMNDVIIFTVMSISSFSSGALISAAGWDWMNLGTLPLLAVVASAVLWVTLWRRRARVTRNAKAT
ncbi:MAG TPA: MFS transporter, partial [Casimicrobiaceae bacterium]|nr:MFS transporter [Casimicrobiaceae bacterium]